MKEPGRVPLRKDAVRTGDLITSLLPGLNAQGQESGVEVTADLAGAPAGSTVTPIRSPAATPDASTGTVLPPVARVSRPADVAVVVPTGPMTHSWYTSEPGRLGRPVLVNTSRCSLGATTTVAEPPSTVRPRTMRAPGALSTAAGR